MRIRISTDRGYAERSWLKTWHSFSFADYYDPEHMNFGHLRVINDDIILGGGGFPTHPHRDMEIITYLLDGALEHRDSMGNGSVIRPGEVQRMSAGTGVAHSEFNHSPTEAARLLQIWIMPDRLGHQPGYEQKEFPAREKRGTLRLVASRNGDDGSVSINQDLNMFAGMFNGEEQARLELGEDRKAWVQVARGHIGLNGEMLQEGDGVAVEEESALEFSAGEDAEVLVFEMAREAG